MNEKKFGTYVFVSLAVCALIGAGLGLSNGNTFNGLWIGALIGVFIGWFIAAVVLRKDKS